MMELLGDIDLSLDQATWIAAAMYQVAAADGVHQREAALINAFYHGCCEDAGALPKALGELPWSTEGARAGLPSASLREAAYKSCWLVALAHGPITTLEAGALRAMAGTLEISEADAREWEHQTRAYLLGPFSAISVFKAEARQIGQQLGVSEQDLSEIIPAGDDS